MPLDSLDILNADVKPIIVPPAPAVISIPTNDVIEKPKSGMDVVKNDNDTALNLDLDDGMQISGTIINGKLDGICKVFKNKVCIAELSYINGLKDGICNFFQDSILMASFEYKNDQKNGIATYYNAAGHIQKTETYKDDLKNGLSVTYYDTSEIFERCEYENGKLKTPPIRFDLKGKEISSSR